MEIRGATVRQVEQAAKAAHVRAYYPTEIRHTRDGKPVVRVTLKTDESKSYRRFSERTTYRNGAPRVLPGSVCWHGHREFMRALYRLAPDAVIVTALARYDGSEHFERTFESTRALPAQRMGVALTVAIMPCDCSEA